MKRKNFISLLITAFFTGAMIPFSSKGENMSKKISFDPKVNLPKNVPINYPITQLDYYVIYDKMDYFSQIHTSLDALMYEVSKDFKFEVNHRFINHNFIQKDLNKLFYDKLNIRINLPLWTRNLAKYGTNYVYFFSEKHKGILHTKQILNLQVETLDDGYTYHVRNSAIILNKFEILDFHLYHINNKISMLDKYILNFIKNPDSVNPLFSEKEINRLKQSVIQTLNKAAIIHLYLKGYSQDELSAFKITL